MCDIKRCFNQSKCSLTCKHEKGLSKHEKGLSKHEKGLSKHEKGLSKHEKGLSKHEKGLSKHEKGLGDLNQSKMNRQFVTKGSKFSSTTFLIFPGIHHLFSRAETNSYQICD